MQSVFHVVFTTSGMNTSHCYINGKDVNCIPIFARSNFIKKETNFIVAKPVSENNNLTELFLWSSEMTPKQVIEEYQGNFRFSFLKRRCGVFTFLVYKCSELITTLF